MDSRVIENVRRRGRARRADAVEPREWVLAGALVVVCVTAVFCSVGANTLARWTSLSPFLQW
jgi:hypothetical protein